MRKLFSKRRLGFAVSTAVIAGVAMVPATAMAAPMPQGNVVKVNAAQQLPADRSGDSLGIKVGKNGSVQVGDRVCAGNCNGTVNGSSGSHGGICAGICNGSANGGTGTQGAPGKNGGNGGRGGVCVGVCHGSVNGGNGGNGGNALPGGDGGTGGKGGKGGICVGLGCQTSGQGGRGGTGGDG
ncbi:hypothetical protein ACLB9X_09895 [Streptomyces sp. 5K101]|uniref:hypothetical protein n=1 Tax=Streptomyces sp. 5K101 TaxID=3390037 RepID=UPI003974BB3E